MTNEKRKKISIEDESLYTKLVLAAFFMFIIPVLLVLYLIFMVILNKESQASVGYARLVIFWMVVSGLFGYVVIKKTIRSILNLIGKAKDISEGKFKGKIEVLHGDELKDLATAFNRITSDLEKKIKELEYSRSLTRELFQKIGHAITSTQKQEALLNLVVQSTRKVLKAEASFVVLYDDKDNKLRLKAYAGSQKNLTENMELPDDKGVIGLVMQTKKPMVIKKPKLEEHAIQPEEEKISYKNILCVPVLEKNKAKGVMAVCDPEDVEKIDTEDLFLLENIAGHIAKSMENFKLNQSIEETYFETLLTLAKAVEARDPYSGGHLERVSAYVEEVADRLGMDKETKKILRGGAILHDLGKVGIQDNILKKPGRYTPEEYEIMKQHAIIGENILKPLRSMANLGKLVRHHHEHYDGTGYPDGLVGEEIPLLSRILTIADVYDALTTERPYKKAIPPPEAVKAMRKDAGNMFDPKLVEVFIGMLKDMPLGYKEKKK